MKDLKKMRIYPEPLGSPSLQGPETIQPILLKHTFAHYVSTAAYENVTEI
ncbi:hypothetical protein [Methylotuvimicrobium sp. KM1]